MLRQAVNFKNSIKDSINQRVLNNIPMLPLNVEQVSNLCNIIEFKHQLNNELLSDKDFEFFMYLFKEKIVPGVDETSYLKANFLNKICLNKINTDLIDKKEAISILGTMQGGYNVEILTNLLDNYNLAELASNELKKTTLIFDHYYDIEKKSKMGNVYAKEIIKSWADAEWFKNNKPLNEKITLTVFKVNGDTNTDDLSPAQDAWSIPYIPLHAQSMLKNPRTGIIPDKDYEIGPLKMLEKLKNNLNPIVYVGDVVGTGSSRKSATNSILWHFGKDIPHVPNKRTGGYCFGTKIAPIFYNTMEDSGALPIEMDVGSFYSGQIIDVYPYQGITNDVERH